MTDPKHTDIPPPSSPTRWRAYWPAPVSVDLRERLRVVLGAALGVGLTCVLSLWAAQALGSTGLWMIAAMGASAVLVFGVSSSPMAQPWAVVVSHTTATLVGVACARWAAPTELAAALAVGLSIAVMFALRCMHPPAGGTALMMVLGGLTDARLALFPVALNALLLVLAGLAYHRATRRHYPHSQLAPATTPKASSADSSLEAELDEVLKRYNQVLDISREDLQALLHQTQLQAYQHKLERLSCADIMVRELITVGHATALTQARSLLQGHRIKALPVVDADQRLVGIVTQADLVRGSAQQADVVGEIMTRQVRVASMDRHLVELIPLFGSTGHHHIPIIDAGRKLVGMVTQTDVVGALCAPQPTLKPGPARQDPQVTPGGGTGGRP